MKLNDTLTFSFNTKKPLDGSDMNSAVAPVITVYQNGAVLVPVVPAVVANPAVGRYTVSFGLTAANGFALNDWVSITAAVVLDGTNVTMAVWEGALVASGADVACILNQTIYPIFTTHQPSTGANQALDGGALPTIVVYRNQVATVIAPVLANPAVGVWICPLPLTGATGWAIGDMIDISAAGTIDGIASTTDFFTDGMVVANLGGGGASRHEVIGHEVRFA